MGLVLLPAFLYFGGMDRRLIAVMSYLWLLWFLAFFTFAVSEQKDPLARFHLRQSFGLGLLSVLALAGFWLADSNLFYFSAQSLVVLLLSFAGWIYGFKMAMDEKEKPVPLVGRLFQQWFVFI